jgi:hypothetical protein
MVEFRQASTKNSHVFRTVLTVEKRNRFSSVVGGIHDELAMGGYVWEHYPA